MIVNTFFILVDIIFEFTEIIYLTNRQTFDTLSYYFFLENKILEKTNFTVLTLSYNWDKNNVLTGTMHEKIKDNGHACQK